jgi:hypothetical protein
MLQYLYQPLVVFEVLMKCLLCSLLVGILVCPGVVEGDEDVAGAFKTVCDALDLFKDPGAVARLALCCVVIQGFHLGLHHWTTLTPDYGVNRPRIAFLVVRSFDERLHRFFPNHFLAPVFRVRIVGEIWWLLQSTYCESLADRCGILWVGERLVDVLI